MVENKELVEVQWEIMISPGTFGDMLLRNYTVDFIANIQKLASPNYSTPGGINKPKVALKYMGSTNEGIKGKTLFRERWFDKWSIQKMPPDSVGPFPYESALGHQCNRFGSIYYFTMWPGEEEACFSCQEPIPENLIGLWKMQNYEIYTQLEE